MRAGSIEERSATVIRMQSAGLCGRRRERTAS